MWHECTADDLFLETARVPDVVLEKSLRHEHIVFMIGSRF